jgi:hypothetical protein
VTYLIRLALALGVLTGLAAPASAQQTDAPPAPFWRIEANGDAVQTFLGFILPARWQGFERTGFTSPLPNGAIVTTHYRRADGPLKLDILIWGRADIEGVPRPGADGIERNWPFIQREGAAGYPSEAQPEELAGGRIAWGASARPNARMQLRRYRLPGRDEVQGIWFRTIGTWSVAIIVSGPADRRADIEATGRAAMTGIQWPGAPPSAELAAIEPEFVRDLADCQNFDRGGTGQPVDPGAAISAAIATVLSANFLDTAIALPHPALDPRPYCRIETFRVGEYEVIALGWQGDVAGYPAARYAFLLAGRGLFFQFESFFTIESVPAAERRGIGRLVWLTASGNRKVTVYAVLTDWPSYERAKEMILSIGQRVPPAIVEITHPSGQVHAIVNYSGQAAPTAPAPQPAPQ